MEKNVIKHITLCTNRNSIDERIKNFKEKVIRERIEGNRSVSTIKFLPLLEFCCLKTFMKKKELDELLKRKYFNIISVYFEGIFFSEIKTTFKNNTLLSYFLTPLGEWNLILEEDKKFNFDYPTKIFVQHVSSKSKLLIKENIEILTSFPDRKLLFPYFLIQFKVSHDSNPLLFFSHKEAILFIYNKEFKRVDKLPVFKFGGFTNKRGINFEDYKEAIFLRKILIEINTELNSFYNTINLQFLCKRYKENDLNYNSFNLKLYIPIGNSTYLLERN